MKTFKSFIKEERSVAQAVKLGSYIAKRHSPLVGKFDLETTAGKAIVLHHAHDHDFSFGMDMHDEFARKADKHKVHGQNFRDTIHDPKHSTVHSDFPTNKLKHSQQYVEFTKKYFTSTKLKDDAPITAYKHKGEFHIVDGHHRWFRDRLLGRKTSNVRVVHFGEDYKI